jgi:hypothetical protein
LTAADEQRASVCLDDPRKRGIDFASNEFV